MYSAAHHQSSADITINLLTPNDPYMGRTAPLTSKRCILYIYSTNIGHHHHKHQGLDPLIRSDSRVTAALANVF